MSGQYNPDLHHRRSIRLRNYDYSQAGLYFVTLCTFQRECLFGEIKEGRMRPNEYGRIVDAEWFWTAFVRSEIGLDAYVIMPNHLHGIIVISKEAPEETDGASDRATRRVAPTTTTEDHPVHPNGPPSGSLGAIIGQFKSVVTKQINALRSTPGQSVWQRNYYEHVLRDEDELNKIREYITYNPANWPQDEHNPLNPIGP